MIRKIALVASASLVLLAGCGGGGDINIQPSTTDNSVNNSNNTTTDGGSTASNPCASYVDGTATTRQGTFDGTNCTYSAAFVDSGNNLTVDLTIPALTTGGAHIFQGSLFVGEAYDTDADLAAAGITQGGDGPTLTLEAGTTLAFQSSANFMVINRGSQLIAAGTANNPITLTSASDVAGDLDATPEAVSQWGGLVIDGFGVTNACAYTGTRGVDLALTGECHVASEGSAGLDENFYGGNNDDDSSGRLEYVVVKHTGAQVANGDELNGITWGAVGRGTIVNNLEVYSVFDDGIEMFGGAVSFTNYAAIYVRDDSIDIDEGWIGTIDTALVVQSETDGNTCIEADGIGGFSGLDPAVIEDFIARGLQSAPTISNLTCIISPNGPTTATHDPGAGIRFREGITPTLNDVLVIGAFVAADLTSATDNYCLRLDDRSAQAAADGDLELNSVIYACEERAVGTLPAPDGRSAEQFAIDSGNVFATIAGAVDATAMADTDLQLLEGTPPLFSIDYATMQVDGAVPAGAPQAGDFIGALSQSATNPFANWTFGIFDGSRNQPFYFE
ncbi:MAG TPA: hypothetical protein VLA56_10155 [Pseudomonadales bacterium]|nr:hypothetical protein [Pseudomonadales bacterium]